MSSESGKANFGEVNIINMFFNKVSFKSMPGSGESMPSIVSLLFEINGAFQHECFWNIAIFRNLSN